MNKKENRKKLRDGFIEAIYDNAEVLLEIIPGVGGAASKIFKVVKDSLDNYQEITRQETPLYMDCVTFCCKNGCFLSEGQQEMLTEIVTGNYEGDNSEALESVMDFIEEYTDINFAENDFLSEDDGCIEDEAIWFNFQEYSEFPYDDKKLENVMGALNSLLGVSIFDRFNVAGHNESWDL